MLTAAEIEEWEMEDPQDHISDLHAMINRWAQRAVKAEQERDELLRVLKETLPYLYGIELRSLWMEADSLIAKIEGENNAKG